MYMRRVGGNCCQGLELTCDAMRAPMWRAAAAARHLLLAAVVHTRPQPRVGGAVGACRLLLMCWLLPTVWAQVGGSCQSNLGSPVYGGCCMLSTSGLPPLGIPAPGPSPTLEAVRPQMNLFGGAVGTLDDGDDLSDYEEDTEMHRVQAIRFMWQQNDNTKTLAGMGCFKDAEPGGSGAKESIRCSAFTMLNGLVQHVTPQVTFVLECPTSSATSGTLGCARVNEFGSVQMIETCSHVNPFVPRCGTPGASNSDSIVELRTSRARAPKFY